MTFDNRARKIRRGERRGLHFAFEANNKRILYCYIRKNACSSFKRLMVAQSPHKDKRGEFPTSLQFLAHFHADRSQKFDDFDHTIFVIRDPFERLASVYKNKFIQRSGHEGIFKSYAEVTGKDPETASFADFMTDYVRRPFARLDLHVHPQADNLLPAVYTDAIPLDQLHNRMTDIVGPQLADRFFLRKVNSTSETGALALTDAHTVPSIELHRMFSTQNTLPATESLLAPPLRRRIGTLYKRDFELFEHIGPGTRPLPGRAATPAWLEQIWRK